jgi:hypothetical protein
MIPSTTNQLLTTEDWKKIYQSFKNAEFQSYDFETLRRTMITYLRENYPEEFNDYIDSSEYIALIDLIAFLGQNLSFRVDLNARENFLETAERRDSILRLAQLISYNPKRNVPANGMMKIMSVSTTESVIDANGVNLANSIVGWNDPTNANWYQRFIAILNAAMTSPMQFGKPSLSGIINNITTEQYRINSSNTDVPVFSFKKNISGSSLSFEVVSSTFAGKKYIYEETPKPGNQFGFIFQNDNQGSGSSNTGFFVHFRQGTLSTANFTITSPVPNELIGLNVNNINDTDVWLWQLNSDRTAVQTLWSKVPSLTGNNVIYNSLSVSDRNVYTVLTRNNDQIDLSFADGSFGNLPSGPFRVYYRQSSASTYTIKPGQMNNISIRIPYISQSGQSHVLTMIVSLKYSVTNSAGAETNANIKLKAPQTYYTQNRMITGEDYNIAPLNVSPDIIKIKSINRVSSGISKYYELSDVSGAYSSTDIFASDGVLYKENKEYDFQFSFTTRNEIFSFIQKELAPIINSPGLKSFYLDQYPRVDISSYQLIWNQSNVTTNQTRGYFNNSSTGPASVGYFSSGNLQYIVPGSLIKFVAPTGSYFLPNGKLTTTPDDTSVSYIWSKVANVIGDGSNNGLGNLDDGTGPVILSGNIVGNGTYYNSAIPSLVIPPYVNILPYGIQTEIANTALSKRNFGLGFDKTTRAWYIILDTNLDLSSPFSFNYQTDITNSNLDSSWLVAFQWTGKQYNVRYRELNYIFESAGQTAFFVDNSLKNYDFVNDTVVKDKIDVLSINKRTYNFNPDLGNYSLGVDYSWQIDSAVVESDGYIEPKKVIVSLYDRSGSGQIDDPDIFVNIVDPDHINKQTSSKDSFVYFYINGSTHTIYTGPITAYPNSTYVSSPQDGELYYFYDDNINTVQSWSADTGSFIVQSLYYARPGRNNLKFHYLHNSGNERRLDPSKMNIIDVYLLSSSYDAAYRSWLSSGTGSEPLAPTTQSLENNYSSVLEPIKSISDEIVYHPARYKVLFGSQAPTPLQAIFKAVQSPSSVASATSLQTRILDAINKFFAIENWNFGQTFNFGELVTYVMNTMTPDITNLVIVPKSSNNGFGSLFQITCQSNEIFISGATVSDIQIISNLTETELNASSIVTSS